LSGVLGLLLIGAGWTWMSLHRAMTARPVMRFSIELPVGDTLGGTWYWYPSLAVSDDGTQVAYVGHRGGESQIYVRGIGETTARAVPGTEGADMPFFSPDGQWLGIYSGGMIKRCRLPGDRP
jgi:hypothetical protein